MARDITCEALTASLSELAPSEPESKAKSAKRVVRLSAGPHQIVSEHASNRGITLSQATDELVLKSQTGTSAGDVMLDKRSQEIVAAYAARRGINNEASIDALILYAFNRLEALRKDAEKRKAGK